MNSDQINCNRLNTTVKRIVPLFVVLCHWSGAVHSHIGGFVGREKEWRSVLNSPFSNLRSVDENSTRTALAGLISTLVGKLVPYGCLAGSQRFS